MYFLNKCCQHTSKSTINDMSTSFLLFSSSAAFKWANSVIGNVSIRVRLGLMSCASLNTISSILFSSSSRLYLDAPLSGFSSITNLFRLLLPVAVHDVGVAPL